MPITPRPTSVFQFARITGQSSFMRGRANGASINSANNQRKNVIAIGGMSAWTPRPMIQLTDQNSGAKVSNR